MTTDRDRNYWLHVLAFVSLPVILAIIALASATRSGS